MNENADNKTHANTNIRKLTTTTTTTKKYTCKCKFQLEHALPPNNSQLHSLLQDIRSRSHLRRFKLGAQSALSVCVFYVVIAFHDTNSNGLRTLYES